VTMRCIHWTLLGAAAVVATAACHTGPSAESYYGVTEGRGIRVKLLAGRKERTDGEVLEVRDSALVILGEKCAVSVVPFASIRLAAFKGINPAYEKGIPTADERAELKMLSRFPGGMPPSVLDYYAQCASTSKVGAALPDANTFLAIARRETNRYQQLDSAIAAGYRRIGGDIPSLGEHWVHPGLVMSGPIDPARPSVLIYTRTATGPVLAGVAWTKVLAAGEPYPDAPVGREAWHEHNGSVAIESLPMHHDHSGMAATEPTRVAILHAWIWIGNPRGTWVADNWALPFVRAGLRADSVAVAAAQALSLTTPGAVEYYTRATAVSRAANDSSTLEHERAMIAAAAADAAAVRAGAAAKLSAAQVARLGEIWTALQLRLASPARSAGDPAPGSNSGQGLAHGAHDGIR